MDFSRMGGVFQPVLFFLARCTSNQLIRQIDDAGCCYLL
jgi:hypothetical protein